MGVLSFNQMNIWFDYLEQIYRDWYKKLCLNCYDEIEEMICLDYDEELLSEIKQKLERIKDK